MDSAVKFIQKHNFDGLDLDWEYPGKRGGVAEDKENFIALIKDLHAVFAPKKLLLTAAIGAAQGTIDAAYDVEKMYKYLVIFLRVKRRTNYCLKGLCTCDVL